MYNFQFLFNVGPIGNLKLAAIVTGNQFAKVIKPDNCFLDDSFTKQSKCDCIMHEYVGKNIINQACLLLPCMIY